MSEKLLVPDIGEFENVEVIEILVKSGEQIKKNDPLITIESDKSSVEIPSTFNGTVESISIKVGDKVSKGDLILNISLSKEVSQEKIVPKDTENIIKEAEAVLETKKEKDKQKKQTEDKKEKIIQSINENDIDPLETKDWLESMSAVLEKDGKHRAQFLIKELIDYSYKEGSDLVLSRNTSVTLL